MFRPLLILAALGVSVAASASSPQLNYVLPRGGQRGTDVDVTFTGARLKDAQEVILYDKGIAVSDLKATSDQAVTAHVKIAPDAPLGEYRMRLRCSSGVSELRTFWVGPFPTTQSWAAAAPPKRQQGNAKQPPAGGAVPNVTWEAPQPVAMNMTVEGVVQNEQVHYFKVDVKKGQRLSAEVEGMRLGTSSRGNMFDPYLSIVEPNRFVLAESDDTALLHQDPYLSLVASKDETLILEVRDSSFGGGGDAHYRMHVGTFPRPAVCFPLGGKVGETLDVTFLGDPTGPIKQKVTLPNEASGQTEQFAVYAEKDGQSPPSPNYLRVSDFPNVMKGESDQNHEMGKAIVAPMEPPLAFNGIVGKADETDYYKFKGHKGQTVDVSVWARRLGSPLDSVIVVYDPKGQYLGANDDAGTTPDSVLRFTPPMDGDYTVAIRDHLKAGGADYAYRIEVSTPKPLVAVTIPNATQVNGPTQERQTIDVPRGGRYGTLIRASHQTIPGELQVIASQLPEGITMTAVPTAADVTPVIFEAKADAPIAGRLCEFGVERVAAKDAKGDEKEQEPIKGEVFQQVELVIGQPNNTPYSHTTVHQFAVAVTKEAAYSIDLVEPKAPLVQGGQVKVKVKATRHGDFKGPITLRMLFDPPGVSGGTVEIPADKTEIDYPLSASEGAPTKTWKVALLGEANVDGPLWVSTNLVDLHVADPFITGKIQMTAAEQGSTAQVVCDLTQANKFEGKATLRLLGLPPNASAEPKEVTADDKKVVFDVVTTPKTNPGQTTGMFVQAALQVEGEEVAQTFAKGGVIRVDPAKAQDANKKQAVAVKQAPSDKPVSRLDKLRQEQAEAKK